MQSEEQWSKDKYPCKVFDHQIFSSVWENSTDHAMFLPSPLTNYLKSGWDIFPCVIIIRGRNNWPTTYLQNRANAYINFIHKRLLHYKCLLVCHSGINIIYLPIYFSIFMSSSFFGFLMMILHFILSCQSAVFFHLKTSTCDRLHYFTTIKYGWRHAKFDRYVKNWSRYVN